MKPFEPSASLLAEIKQCVDVELIEFDTSLVRLKDDDYLPRYNRVRVTLLKKGPVPCKTLYVTVRRHGSSIGDDNFYTVPIFVPELDSYGACVYDVYSFDSFNLPFETVSVNMTDADEYAQRRLSKSHIGRAAEHTKFLRAKVAA